MVRGMVRYAWLSQYLFDSIDEVKEFVTRWLWSYNNEKPNMALGGITPVKKPALAAWPLLLKSVKNGGITEGRGDPDSDIQSLIERSPKEPVFLNC